MSTVKKRCPVCAQTNSRFVLLPCHVRRFRVCVGRKERRWWDISCLSSLCCLYIRSCFLFFFVHSFRVFFLKTLNLWKYPPPPKWGCHHILSKKRPLPLLHPSLPLFIFFSFWLFSLSLPVYTLIPSCDDVCLYYKLLPMGVLGIYRIMFFLGPESWRKRWLILSGCITA